MNKLTKQIVAGALIAAFLLILSPNAIAQNAAYIVPPNNNTPPNGYMTTTSPATGVGIIPNPGYGNAQLALWWRESVVTYDTTTTARTIMQPETGTNFVTTTASSDDTTTFTLPTAVQGLHFTFIKANTTASSVLGVKPATGDKIAGGTTTTGGIRCSSTSGTLELIAIDDTNWVRKLTPTGTWTVY